MEALAEPAQYSSTSSSSRKCSRPSLSQNASARGARGRVVRPLELQRDREAVLMVAGELALRQGLGAEAPSRASRVVAETSWARLNRSRVRRWVAAGSVVATIAVVWLFSRFALPDIQRLVVPEPPLVTKTFSISCLSPQQAATLLQPYLPVPLNPRWQAEHFSVTPAGPGIRAVTVRAPQSTIDLVPDLLARFETDPGAACRQ